MTNEQFAKLPKFARDKIEDLQRQRDTAVAALKKWTDEQTPSPISITEMEYLDTGAPTHIIRYIQGRRFEVKHGGITLRIRLLEKGGFDSLGIGLQWEDSGRAMSPVAFVPKSYQQAELVSKENMQ